MCVDYSQDIALERHTAIDVLYVYCHCCEHHKLNSFHLHYIGLDAEVFYN